MHQFRDKSARAARARLRRAALLPGAAWPPTCSPTAPTRCRSARTSASTSSSCATSRGASTRASATDARRPRAPDPGGRRADHGPAGPDAEDVDDRRAREEGTVYVLDEPEAIEKKLKRAVTDSGTEIAPRPRQARRHEPHRHPRGRPRDDAPTRSRRDMRVGPRLRRPQGAPRRGRDRDARAGARALRRAARRRGRARGRAGRRRREGARDRRPVLADVREAMGVGPRRARVA